jgi:hypothetical protein
LVVREYIVAVVVQTDVTGKLKDTRKSKYQEEFMKFGFTSVVSNGDEWPQWVRDML